MAALAWLLIPLVAAVAASLWGSWVGRRRTKTPDAAGVAGYERFRAAMERSSAAETAPDAAAGTGTGADVAAGADGTEARRGARRWRLRRDAELASAGASAHSSTDGPAREAG
ncbi:hypothetical protein ACH4RA_05590 [Streptomyces smyrnaeus]|uniref:hypothetical protein n=1 Tax=Streptomyces TaxID=1883 RepID=UPI0016116BBA|nr:MULTISPECIES: hypothetical protein [unclassified Streptomyces]MBQ0867943.1 hypothetical protein [Streptomyces sp. RK75]MBQ1124756.1 hypothetical protein [Streptomyces sp. B15]